MKNVCAFTSICAEDAGWVGRYLREAERLSLSFAVHLDRCAPGDCDALHDLVSHDLCVGHTHQPNPAVEFTEQHKQAVLDLVAGLEFKWAMAWDVDETFEATASHKIMDLTGGGSGADWVAVRWLNLWGDRNHVRVDGEWANKHRVKFLNLAKKRREKTRWVFDHPVTNGPKLVGVGDDRNVFATAGELSDLVCLHWGMMTPALRRLHLTRWDRIYSTALRGDANPYGFWRDAVATEGTAVTAAHDYLPYGTV